MTENESMKKIAKQLKSFEKRKATGSRIYAMLHDDFEKFFGISWEEYKKSEAK